MKPLGNFGEFAAPTSGLPSITAALRPEMPASLRRLLSFYLVQGSVLMSVMERRPDVLDDENVFLTAGLRTDGEWFWRADLAHYVMKYGLEFPADFLATAESNSWTPPKLSDEACGALARSIRGKL